MKKTILLCWMMLLAGTAPLCAQLHVDLSPQLKFGLTAGLNIPHTTVSDSEMKTYVERAKPGFLVGPSVSYMLPVGRTKPLPYLGADLSVHYDQRSAEPEDEPKTTITSRTVQVPLNLRYGININDVATPFLFVGAQMAFNVGKKEQVFAEGTGRTTGHAMVRKWVSKPSALSLNFGVGIIAMERLQARIGYNLPLQKMANIVQEDLETGMRTTISSGKMGSCQIMVSWLF